MANRTAQALLSLISGALQGYIGGASKKFNLEQQYKQRKEEQQNAMLFDQAAKGNAFAADELRKRGFDIMPPAGVEPDTAARLRVHVKGGGQYANFPELFNAPQVNPQDAYINRRVNMAKAQKQYLDTGLAGEKITTEGAKQKAYEALASLRNRTNPNIRGGEKPPNYNAINAYINQLRKDLVPYEEYDEDGYFVGYTDDPEAFKIQQEIERMKKVLSATAQNKPIPQEKPPMKPDERKTQADLYFKSLQRGGIPPETARQMVRKRFGI